MRRRVSGLIFADSNESVWLTVAGGESICKVHFSYFLVEIIFRKVVARWLHFPGAYPFTGGYLHAKSSIYGVLSVFKSF